MCYIHIMTLYPYDVTVLTSGSTVIVPFIIFIAGSTDIVPFIIFITLADDALKSQSVLLYLQMYYMYIDMTSPY